MLRRLLPVLIPLLLIAAGWQIRDIWVVRSVGGVYVLPDGASYVVLKRGVVPAVRAPEGFIWTDRGQPGAPLRVSGLRAILLGNELILKQTLVSDISRGTDGTARLRDSLTLYLRPSHSVPGDWDLVSANLDKKANALYSDYPKPMGGYATDLLGPKDPNASFWSSLGRMIRRGQLEWVQSLFTGVLDPAAAPIPSFLHRVKDPRVARYFNNQLHGVDSKEDLETLRQLDRRDRPDIYLALHHLTLETRIGSVEDAERIWERWSAVHGKQARGMARRTAEKAHRILLSAQWLKKYPDLGSARDFWETTFAWSPDTRHEQSTPQDSEKGLDMYLTLLRNVGKTDSPFFPVARLAPPSLKSPDESPYFLPIQVLAGMARAEAVFSLFKGDRPRSLETLAGCYWVGESLNGGGIRIERSIGIAMRAAVTTGLETYALSGCETAEELRTAWDVLEHLANLPGQETDFSWWAVMITPILGEMELSGPYASGLGEFQIPQKVSDVRFAILRVAVAARYHLLIAGEFPKAPAEFGPLLPGGPLSDCFATSAPLRFLQKPDGFHIYSVGPDGRDDAAAKVYDPTNGSGSRGDITLRIPREREYPFPAGGVRVNTAAELLKMFPNGLPPDPFANERGRPLSIIASSGADWESCVVPGARKGAPDPKGAGSAQDSPPAAVELPATPSSGADARTSSVIVFSFGRDRDEAEHVSLQHLTGKDVFTTYSVPAARLQLVFAPNATRVPPPSTQAGTIQAPFATAGRLDDRWGMRYGWGRFPPVNPAAYPFWQPAYDPTNGSISNGNLYLEIPRP